MTQLIDWEAIPPSLAKRQQWLLWRFEVNPKRPEGKALKVPYWVTGTVRNGTQGSDKDRARLATLDNARRVFERSGGSSERITPAGQWAGVGFAFLPGDGLIGIDIDGAIDEDGVIRPRDQVIIDLCSSYTEYSPSGRGVHILVEGTTAINKFDPIGLEVYCGALWFTFTARRWPGASGEVKPIEPHVLEGLHKTINDAKAEAQEQKRLADDLNAQLERRRPQASRRAQPQSTGVDDFRRVNEAAMNALDLWVPSLFPGAKKRGSQGYRISSHDLGRDLEEDLSIHPKGIKDFGVHDRGDARDGGRTPIDLVIEWGRVGGAREALDWLASRLSIELTPFKPAGGRGSSPPPRRRPQERPAAGPEPDPQSSDAGGPAGGSGGPPDGPPPGHPADAAPDDHDEDWELARNRRGDPLDCRENVLYALANDKALKGLVSQNMFTELHERTREAPWGRAAGEWDEEDDLMLGEYLLRTYGLMTRSVGTIRSGVTMAARLNRYNPVHDLIHSQEWDGTPRLDTWLVEAFDVEDRPYTRLIGRCFLMGMVKRALHPGCKFDYMLILKGEQGLSKSTAFRVLAEPFFTDTAIQMGNKESLMTMQLVWLAESAELESMNRSESTAIKQFLSAQEDWFRPPYGARMLKRPRHAVNVGTTNADTFLKDATGDRRFWPLEVLVVRLERIKELRLQLFAEALHRLKAGELTYPTRDEERTLVFPEQERFKMTDVWTDILAEYVNRTNSPLGEAGEEPPARRAFFSTQELFSRAIGIKAERIDGNKQMETRIANSMRALGFTRFRERRSAYQRWGYLRPGSEYGKPVILPVDPKAPRPPPPPSAPPGAAPERSERDDRAGPERFEPVDEDAPSGFDPSGQVSRFAEEDDDVPV